MNRQDSYRKMYWEIHTQGENIAGRMDGLASEIAAIVKGLGGPNYGTALFGRAKLLEAAPIPCLAQEVEEWAHLEYFLTGFDTQVIFLAPAGSSRERVLAMMRTVNRVNGFVVAVADPADDEVRELAHQVWPVPPQEEMFSPIACSVPLKILAYGAMVTQNSAPFRLDSSGNSGVIYQDERKQ